MPNTQDPGSKICPLAFASESDTGVFYPCQGENCAWYDVKYKRCCIVSVAIKPKG